jgi:hypothetical protein
MTFSILSILEGNLQFLGKLIKNAIVIESECRNKKRDSHSQINNREIFRSYDSGGSENDPGGNHQAHQEIAFEIEEREETGFLVLEIDNPPGVFERYFRKNSQIEEQSADDGSGDYQDEMIRIAPDHSHAFQK